MWYVYILQCKDNRSYVGCTHNLKDRLSRHSKGYIPATKNRLPIKLVSYIAISSKEKAFDLEKYFKSGVGRSFLSKRIF